MTAQTIRIAEILGGAPVLRRPVRSDLDLVEAVRGGIPTRAVEQMVLHGLLDRDEVYALIAPKRTYLLRRQRRQPLSPAESERVARVARIFAVAEDAFQSTAKAAAWLRKPSRVLGGKVPLELLRTEPGARLVEEELVRIDRDVYG